jgi:hypothetical protein
MGLRILTDGDNAVMYCSTSDWSLGPVFGQGEDGTDPQERILRFWKWLDSRLFTFEVVNLPPMFTQRLRLDARSLTEKGLQDAYSAWLGSTEENGGAWTEREEVSA